MDDISLLFNNCILLRNSVNHSLINLLTGDRSSQPLLSLPPSLSLCLEHRNTHSRQTPKFIYRGRCLMIQADGTANGTIKTVKHAHLYK